MSDTAELIEDRLKKSVREFYAALDTRLEVSPDRPVEFHGFTKEQAESIANMVNGAVKDMIMATRNDLKEAIIHAVAEEFERMATANNLN